MTPHRHNALQGCWVPRPTGWLCNLLETKRVLSARRTSECWGHMMHRAIACPVGQSVSVQTPRPSERTWDLCLGQWIAKFRICRCFKAPSSQPGVCSEVSYLRAGNLARGRCSHRQGGKFSRTADTFLRNWRGRAVAVSPFHPCLQSPVPTQASLTSNILLTLPCSLPKMGLAEKRSFGRWKPGASLGPSVGRLLSGGRLLKGTHGVP